MQTVTISTAAKYKQNQPNNPLKQLFSYNLSPKQKPSENVRQKPLCPPQKIDLAGKYIYSLEDLIGDGFTSKVYKGYEIERPGKAYAIKIIEKGRLSQDQMKLVRNEI